MVIDMRSSACRFSFDDLHLARFGRVMTGDEKDALYALSQNERNKKVGEWARDCSWVTEDITGDDGIVYRSFMPRNYLDE